MTQVSLPGSAAEAADQLAGCYSRKDVEGLLAITSPLFNGFGSGLDEVVHSFEELRAGISRDFSQCDEVTMKFSDTQIKEVQGFAWMIAKCTITARTGSEVLSLTGRMSAAFISSPGGWQIAQTHFSLPYGAQEEGQSFPT
ncbi:nuclear transport factor 2 family protein [uncultured Methanospirillum sp.]|uniref:nuclear transport factor 2 family protein n=1 Tax=uncultured Methanospirillum sp. TaxID=262503 RepID=UPI0029C8E501|nr:nuclear transport factor 2 family protein [uncultured Methanospirillum sp.]